MNMVELRRLVTAERKRMYNHLIYIALKRYGIKYIQDATVKNTKLLVIMDRLGLPITVNLFAYLCGKKVQSCYRNLQSLGDKNVLDLKGYSNNKLLYFLHEDFKPLVEHLDYTGVDHIAKIIKDEGIVTSE